jgi:hypothetical protein
VICKDRACDRSGRKKKYAREFNGEFLKERALLEDLGVNGRILLNWIFRQPEGKEMEKCRLL